MSWNVNGSNLFSTMFSSNYSSGGMSSILGDYNMIRNGTYKKMLKSYYATEDKNKKTESTTEKDSIADKSEKIGLTQTKSAAGTLANAAKDFQSLSSFSITGEETDEEKEKKYKAAEKVIQNFVTAYNDTVEKAGDVDNNSVLKKTLGMISDTGVSSSVLKDIGITIGSDNKLSFSKEKFEGMEAKVVNSAIQTLTKGGYSFAGTIRSDANALSSLSNAALGSRSTYTSSGGYKRPDTNLYESLL